MSTPYMSALNPANGSASAAAADAISHANSTGADHIDMDQLDGILNSLVRDHIRDLVAKNNGDAGKVIDNLAAEAKATDTPVEWKQAELQAEWAIQGTGKSVVSAGDINTLMDLPPGKRYPGLFPPQGKMIKYVSDGIADPNLPDDLRGLLSQWKTVYDGGVIPLTDSQMQILATLQHHRGEIPGGNLWDNDIPDVQPDLKQALQQLKDDPTLFMMVDSASVDKNGNVYCRGSRRDGEIGVADIDALGFLPQMKDYNAALAAASTENYIPSESYVLPPATDGAPPTPRHIELNDAMREIYIYSDSMPQQIDTAALQDIVNCKAGCNQLPMQLIAAAQYMLDNKGDWNKLCGNDSGSVSRESLLGYIAKNVYITPTETDAIQTVHDNIDAFFKNGPLTKDALQKICDDPASTPQMKKAASTLLTDPLVFGILDNGKGYHPIRKHVAVDDKTIDRTDFETAFKDLSTLGKTPPPPPSRPPRTASPVDALVTQFMVDGQQDDPAEKTTKKAKPKGIAAFFHKLGEALKKIGHIVCRVFEEIGHIASMVLSVFAKIPIIGPLFAAASVGCEAIAGGLHIADTAIQGGDIKKAAEEMAEGIGGAALGALLLPGAGAALMKGAAKAVEVGAENAARAVQAGVANAANAVEMGAEKAASAVAHAVTEAPEAIANTVTNVVKEVPEAIANTVTNAVKEVPEAIANTVTNVVKEAPEVLASTAKMAVDAAPGLAVDAGIAGAAVLVVVGAEKVGARMATREAALAAERGAFRGAIEHAPEEAQALRSADEVAEVGGKQVAKRSETEAAEKVAGKEGKDDAKDAAKKKEEDDKKKKDDQDNNQNQNNFQQAMGGAFPQVDLTAQALALRERAVQQEAAIAKEEKLREKETRLAALAAKSGPTPGGSGPVATTSPSSTAAPVAITGATAPV